MDDRLSLADLHLPGGVALVDAELGRETVVANVYDPAAEAEARENEETQTEPTAEAEKAE